MKRKNTIEIEFDEGTLVMYRELTKSEQRKLVQKFTNELISHIKTHIVNDTMKELEGTPRNTFEITWSLFNEVLSKKIKNSNLNFLRENYKKRFFSYLRN